LEIALLSWRWTQRPGFRWAAAPPKPPYPRSSCRRGEFLVASSGAAVAAGRPVGRAGL